MAQLDIFNAAEVPCRFTLQLSADVLHPESPLLLLCATEGPDGSSYSRTAALPGLSVEWAPSIAQAAVEAYLFGEGLRAAPSTAWRMAGDARGAQRRRARTCGS